MRVHLGPVSAASRCVQDGCFLHRRMAGAGGTADRWLRARCTTAALQVTATRGGVGRRGLGVVLEALVGPGGGGGGRFCGEVVLRTGRGAEGGVSVRGTRHGNMHQLRQLPAAGERAAAAGEATRGRGTAGMQGRLRRVGAPVAIQRLEGLQDRAHARGRRARREVVFAAAAPAVRMIALVVGPRVGVRTTAFGIIRPDTNLQREGGR